MRLIARKGKFVCALLTVILSGSLSTGVAFADDEPKDVPAGDGQAKKLVTLGTETAAQSDSAAPQALAPQDQDRRALPAPFDPLLPGSDYLGPTPLIGVPDTNRTPRSILSSMPSLVSHSEQSAAYIFECRSQTVTRSNGHFFFRAYIPTVIEVQEPRAASKKS